MKAIDPTRQVADQKEQAVNICRSSARQARVRQSFAYGLFITVGRMGKS
jgi:hypothetical protein